eukprot:2289218-Amphidinium_carterae.1
MDFGVMDAVKPVECVLVAQLHPLWPLASLQAQPRAQKEHQLSTTNYRIMPSQRLTYNHLKEHEMVPLQP